MSAPLNAKNYLNGIFYVINTALTFGVGVLGSFGATSNGDLSDKYITIITPAGRAFSIWSVIFTFQLIFAVVQFLPKYRSSALVQDGVSYWYVLTCATQAAWSVAFGFEQIILSFVLIVLIWLTLVAIVFFQYFVAKKQQPNNTLVEFWLLRFPFALHCGWLTCASVLNASVVIVYINSDTSTLQLATGIVSLAYLHAVAVWVTLALDRPNFTIAGVIAWASYFINDQLGKPLEAIEERFSETIITSVKNASFAVSILVIGQIVVRSILLTGVTKVCSGLIEKTEEKSSREESGTEYKNMNKSEELYEVTA